MFFIPKERSTIVFHQFEVWPLVEGCRRMGMDKVKTNSRLTLHLVINNALVICVLICIYVFVIYHIIHITLYNDFIGLCGT